jgi:serine/threonine protein phosphatase PrpC
MPLTILSCSIFLALLIIRLSLGFPRFRRPLDVGMATFIGEREVNADVLDWAVSGDEYLFAVAGGVGRGRKGLIGAEEAVRAVVGLFEIAGAGGNPAYFFRQAFHAANSAISRRIADSGAGASLLCAVVRGRRLYYALAGNCQIAVYRGGGLIPLSEGQTINVLARKAFQARKISRADALGALREKRLYNFVGHDGFRDLEIFDEPVALKRRDIIVLMTDGVSDFRSFGQLEDILGGSGDSQAKAEAITKALEKASHPDQDNASALLARINTI